jgi:hypothetical protein
MLQSTSDVSHHLTKLDSLQVRVSHLDHVIDSLNKVSEANTIYTGFFHDMINSQVMTFILIVTIIVGGAGYFSFRGITKKVKELEKYVGDVISKFDKKNIEIGSDIFQLNATVLGYFYLWLRTNNAKAFALRFGLEYVVAIIKTRDLDNAIEHAEGLLNTVNTEKIDKDDLLKQEDKIVEAINEILTQDNSRLKSIATDIRKGYYRLIVTD